MLINSFGNQKNYYLYSKEISDLKYNIAREIIEKHDVFSGYKQTETYKRAIEQPKQLEQLERLGGLERIERIDEVKATNESYHDFSEISGAILYLDPPYEGTTHYGYINSFNSQEFYDWAFEMAKTNIVIISSYSISDERFEVVYSFDKARSNIQSITRNDKCEKLFMVKNS